MNSAFFMVGLLISTLASANVQLGTDSLVNNNGISALSQPDSTFSVKRYRQFLDSLDNNDLNSINIGMEQYHYLLYSSNFASADSLADIFITFFVATITYHNDRMWENLVFVEKLHADDLRNDSTLLEFYRSLDANGLQLYVYGRIYYIDQKPDYLLNQFNTTLSAPFRNYLALRSEEIKVGFSDHDSLLIDFGAVAERMLKWEDHLVHYPQSIIYARARFYYITYLSTLLTGLSQSPAFDKKGYLRMELIRLYDDIAKQNSAMLSGQIVKSFLESLEQGDFRWSPVVRDFYELHGIRNMHTTQVPIR